MIRKKSEKNEARQDKNPRNGNQDTKRNRENNWDILYPEEKEHYPRYKIIRIRKTEDDLHELNKLLKKLNRHMKSRQQKKTEKGTSAKLPKRSSALRMKGSPSASTRLSTEEKQRCMVKMYYGSSKDSHLKHLKEYMTQQKKAGVEEKPVLFGNIGTEEYADKATGRYFKWIISPEKNMTRAELEQLTRAYIDKMERKTGRKYDWQAAVHTDTGHPHIHIVINGNDHEGNPIEKFDPEYVKKWARNDAQNLLTTMLGPRTKEEIAAAREKALDADRPIEADDRIESLARKILETNPEAVKVKEDIRKENMEMIISLHKMLACDMQGSNGTDDAREKINRLETKMNTEYIERLQNLGIHMEIPFDEMSDPEMERRMEHLKVLGLARQKNNGWILKDGWKDTLRILGRYNMYLNTAEHVDKDCKLELYDHQSGMIRGKLKWIYYMDDENVWTNALVIEDKDNKTAWYVPVYSLNLLKGKKGQEDIKAGQEVVLRNVKGSSGKLMPRIYDAKVWDNNKYYLYKKEHKPQAHDEER